MEILTRIESSAQKLSYININDKEIEKFAANMKRSDLRISEIALVKYKWELDDLLQLIFFFNSMNFCFWAEKDKQKWTIEIDGEILDGSIALFRLLEFQLHKNPDFLDTKNILAMKFQEFEKYFKGNPQIPLIEERYENFVNTAKILEEKFNGKFLKILKISGSDSVTMLDIINTNFNTFKDFSKYKGEKVFFQKRAQLQVKMVNDALLSKGKKGLENLVILTAFADYKVPQILRYFKILKYDKDLAKKVDHLELIEKDSEIENEIRIATIWAIELIRQKLSKKFPGITASHIDSYLWKKSQLISKKVLLPYHRTYTTAY